MYLLYLLENDLVAFLHGMGGSCQCRYLTASTEMETSLEAETETHWDGLLGRDSRQPHCLQWIRSSRVDQHCLNINNECKKCNFLAPFLLRSSQS
jgi:hypothetical protein